MRINYGNRTRMVAWPMNWSGPTSVYVKHLQFNKRLISFDEDTLTWNEVKQERLQEGIALMDSGDEYQLGSVMFITGVKTFEGLGSLFGAEE